MECAVLRNDNAKVFVSVIQNHSKLLGISDMEYQLQQSKIYPVEVKIRHSCYPKNVKRWLSGTVSRKKRCRLEFCVLVWCHAAGWSQMPDEKNMVLKKCREDLQEICMDYLPQKEKIYQEFTFEMLWKASSSAYYHS